MDIVEVAPAYDHGESNCPSYYLGLPVGFTAEITGIAAADLVHDFLSMLLAGKPPQPKQTRVPQKDEL